MKKIRSFDGDFWIDFEVQGFGSAIGFDHDGREQRKVRLRHRLSNLLISALVGLAVYAVLQ